MAVRMLQPMEPGAQSLYDLQEAQLQVVEPSIRAGADYRLSLDAVQIQLSVLGRTRLDALRRAQIALGNLEDAIQCPLAPAKRFQSVWNPDCPVGRETSGGTQ